MSNAEKNGRLLTVVDLVGQALHEANPYGLEIEVMASTMIQLQDNPEMDLSVALQNALNDWDI